MAEKFNDVRNAIMAQVKTMLEADSEVLITGSQEFCLPIVNAEGDEGYLVLTFKIPKGSRDGEAYNGYEVADEYKRKQEEKAVKAKEKAEAKARKIERDKRLRAKKAEEKAE